MSEGLTGRIGNVRGREGRTRFYPGAVALVAGALIISGCRSPRVATHEWWDMGTNLAVSLYGDVPGGTEGESRIFAQVEAETRRLVALFSDFSDASALSRISGRRGDTLAIDPEVEVVLKSALAMTEASGGLFDFTMHDLKFLWGLGEGQPGRIPDIREIDSLLEENPVYQRHSHPEAMAGSGPIEPITILPGHRAVLHRQRTRLDLGGIAKGYIVDRLHHLLDSLGVGAHLLQAGGEIRVGGQKPEGKPWSIGIRHPRISDSLCGLLTSASPLAVSTSGDYERFFLKDGRHLHHIFDPRTGRPATASIGVTVVADSSRQTDALTKPLFIMGPDSGFAFARRHGAKAVWFRETSAGVCALPMPEIRPMLALKGVTECLPD